MHFGLLDERFQDAAPCALAFRFGLDHNRTHLAKMRTVEVERSAAEKYAAIGLSNGEVANVFADFGEGPLEQGAVAGKRVHQIIDIGGVVQKRFTH